MRRGVCWFIVGSLLLLTVAGCGRGWFEEREPWRREAEIACLKSGAVKESSGKVRIKSINGPGVCGADFPIKVTELGSSPIYGYAGELRPPAGIPGTQPAAQPNWPITRRPDVPSVSPDYSQPPVDPPVSLEPPATAAPIGRAPLGPLSPNEGSAVSRGYPSEPLPGRSNVAPYPSAAPSYPAGEDVPLGRSRGPAVTGAVGPARVKPAATLACPIVSALDRWITEAVQPAALRWFNAPVVEIRQISAYSCRGMNGQPNARISEHAFGNALDIASFTLADGHKITVKNGWRGTPEEQGFLRDVQATACNQFNTVLAPGSNVYHYDHIHVDLMRRSSGRRICQPAATSGEVTAARARERYAKHASNPGVTGSVSAHRARGGGILGFFPFNYDDGEKNETRNSLTPATPGAD